MAEIRSEQIKQELTKDGTTMVIVSLDYPVVSGIPKIAAKRINTLYRHGAAALFRRIKRYYLSAAVIEYGRALERSAPFHPFEAALTFTVTYNESDMLSLYREFSARTAGEKTVLRYGDTWSLVTGWLIGLDTIFPKKTSFKKLLCKNAAETAAALEKSGTHRFYPKYHRLIRRHFSPDNFYVTNDGVAVFFGTETIAPKTEGIPVFILNTEIA